METVTQGVYDLLIVDEGMYSKERMDELNGSISYKYSLYMLSRGVASNQIVYDTKESCIYSVGSIKRNS